MAVTLEDKEGRLQLAATPAEREQAKDILAARVLITAESNGAPARLPRELANLLARVIEAVASGASVTVGALPEELTTTVAARQLGVSRPTLRRMISEGQIEARKAGTHHRLKTADVLAAKRARLEAQRKAFDELRELEEQLDQF